MADLPIFYAYPEAALFGQMLPKSKIYQHGTVSTKLKGTFIEQVERIVWKYKLAPETINIAATESVPEIQIFEVTLKGEELSQDLLKAIDKAIPFPILFELRRAQQLKVIATFKRQSEADSEKWVISDYFETGWVAADRERVPLPVTRNLERLYQQLLQPLMPHTGKEKESTQEQVERMERIHAKEREIAKIQAKLRREKQYNRRVEINAALKAEKRELTRLQSSKGTE